LERLKQKKEEFKERILPETEREFKGRLQEERPKIKRLTEEEYFPKVKEKEKIIEDLKTRLEAAKGMAGQGSVQLQGEV
jgi:hypothetical protein